MADSLNRKMLKVIENGNCSGCGVCALVSPRVSMELDSRSGFLRPHLASGDHSQSADEQEAREFSRVCPGRSLSAPRAAPHRDPDFGSYESVWEAWAVDDETRHSGSSAGVLTALSQWLLSSGRVGAVTSAASDAGSPSRSVGQRHTAAAGIATTAGSRYAPVSTSSVARLGSGEALVGKPCEVAGVRQLEIERGLEPSLLLSFFCAGTPSQRATTVLLEELGFEPDDVAQMRYRGNGWPGSFEAITRDGRVGRTDYASAWSRVLGRQIETRCRICVDGTGQFSDLAVADFWEADERGYPSFTEASGRSAVIARTKRGHDALLAAAADGVVSIRPIPIAELVAMQPAQTARQRTMIARLAARTLMGKRVPAYRGFVMWRHLFRRPVLSAKHFLGTVIRTRQGR